jgi:hypothetical protein
MWTRKISINNWDSFSPQKMYVGTKCIGTLMPRMTQAQIRASKGVQGWSAPSVETRVLTPEDLVIGKGYNFKGQPERLRYLGRVGCCGQFWYKFNLVSSPNKGSIDDLWHICWCEITKADLQLMEMS